MRQPPSLTSVAKAVEVKKLWRAKQGPSEIGYAFHWAGGASRRQSTENRNNS